jgi:hypothetical protein
VAFGTVIGPGSTGTPTTSTYPQTNELKLDMQPKMVKKYAAMTPFTTITTRTSNDPAHNITIEAIEENEMAYVLEVAVTEAAAGTSVQFKNHARSLVRDTLLFNPRTKDHRIVNADPTSNTAAVTVAKDQCGTTSAIWKQGDEVFAHLPALAETDSPAGGTQRWRTASAINSRIYNLEQLAKLQLKLSRTLNASTTWFGGPGSIRKALQAQKYREWRIKFELNSYFGGRSSTAGSGSDARTNNRLFGVLYNWTNFSNFNGALTESAWDDHIARYMDENPDVSRIAAFIAPNVKRQITYWGKDQIRLSPMSREYGLRINEYIGADVDVDLIPCPLLSKSADTKGWGWFLDLQHIKMKTLEPTALHLEALNVGQSEDIIDTYRGQHSILISNEPRHSMFIGATG